MKIVRMNITQSRRMKLLLDIFPHLLSNILQTFISAIFYQSKAHTFSSLKEVHSSIMIKQKCCSFCFICVEVFIKLTLFLCELIYWQKAITGKMCLKITKVQKNPRVPTLTFEPKIAGIFWFLLSIFILFHYICFSKGMLRFDDYKAKMFFLFWVLIELTFACLKLLIQGKNVIRMVLLIFNSKGMSLLLMFL